MHSERIRRLAWDQLTSGRSILAVAHTLGVKPETVERWARQPRPVSGCWICDEVEPTERTAARYAAARTTRMTKIQSYWMHWPCLMPQHGPGKEHTRPIVLTGWQQKIVDDHPWPFIRGLLHSDGCRATNNVVVRGKPYSYPRWFFVNKSTDILELLGRTLDRVGVEWRKNRPDSISIARRASVALLDEHVGLKQ